MPKKSQTPIAVADLLMRAAEDVDGERPEAAWSLARAVVAMKLLSSLDKRFDLGETLRGLVLETLPLIMLRELPASQLSIVATQLACMAAQLRDLARIEPRELTLQDEDLRRHHEAIVRGMRGGGEAVAQSATQDVDIARELRERKDEIVKASKEQLDAEHPVPRFGTPNKPRGFA